jgi:hypothetical protein
MDEGHVRPVFNQEALFFVRMLYIFTFQLPLAICFVLSLSRRGRDGRLVEESWRLRQESKNSPRAGIRVGSH